ncbi:MAG: hypothetical protein PHX83_16300 [Acidobacteriia bacterium]|nr:hypothetical protein [Terriglobia bacterium]
MFWLLVILMPLEVRGQIIGKPSTSSTPLEEDSDRAMNLIAKLSERLTTQDLNLRRIECQEEVSLERTARKGGETTRKTQRFLMSADRRQVGEFSIDMQLVESHQPMESATAIAPGDLVQDGFSVAVELWGLNHAEAYSQHVSPKEKLDGREVYVVSSQTIKHAEPRRLIIDGKAVPMRLFARSWIDADNGTLLKMEIHQEKLPKNVREFYYDIRYAEPSAATRGMILPQTIRFTRSDREATSVVTQTFSGCRIN